MEGSLGLNEDLFLHGGFISPWWIYFAMEGLSFHEGFISLWWVGLFLYEEFISPMSIHFSMDSVLSVSMHDLFIPMEDIFLHE